MPLWVRPLARGQVLVLALMQGPAQLLQAQQRVGQQAPARSPAPKRMCPVRMHRHSP